MVWLTTHRGCQLLLKSGLGNKTAPSGKKIKNICFHPYLAIALIVQVRRQETQMFLGSYIADNIVPSMTSM